MPVLTAVSSSARELLTLLRCIGFASKSHVRISEHGLNFRVDDSRTMEGNVFLDKAIFTTWHFDASSLGSDETQACEDEISTTNFQVSLPALLETLQIFGSADPKDGSGSRDGAYANGVMGPGSTYGHNSAFDTRTLGLSGLCRISYEGKGHDLCVHLEEGNITTTCNLVTYEPDDGEEIPFDRNQLPQKIIMKASWLHDAIMELSSINPERLTITASPSAPHLSLEATGNFGSTTVDFSKESQLLETFQVPKRVSNTYKFSMVKATAKAMTAAAKVSIRGDHQGVLSLQFLIESENGSPSFVDFRFVPFASDDEDEADETDGSDSH